MGSYRYSIMKPMTLSATQAKSWQACKTAMATINADENVTSEALWAELDALEAAPAVARELALV